MVGKQAEQSGIIRAGAEFVYAMSVATVPKFTVIVGSSYGAGNYAMCGRAYDPSLILAWPNARFAVMGGNQAADTMLTLRVREAEKSGHPLSPEAIDELRETIRQQYEDQTDIRYGAARGWVDAIIPPHDSRLWLSAALSVVSQTTLTGKPARRGKYENHDSSRQCAGVLGRSTIRRFRIAFSGAEPRLSHDGLSG